VHALAVPRSAVLPSGKTGTATVGAIGTQDFHIVLGAHDRTYNASQFNQTFVSLPGGTTYIQSAQTGSGTILCAIPNLTSIALSATFPENAVILFQRKATYVTCEIWDQDTGERLDFKQGVASSTADIAAGTLTVGGPNNTSSISFLRIGVGSVLADDTRPWGVTQANFAQYEFNDNGTDIGGNGYNLAWSGGTDPTFADSFNSAPAPTCLITTADGYDRGLPQGSRVTVQSAAISNNEGSFTTYRWRVTEGGDRTGFAITSSPSLTSGSFTFEAPQAGQYTFQLTATDSGGTSTCSKSIGIVAQTATGLVLLDESTSDKQKFAKLLGPLGSHKVLKDTWPYLTKIGDTMADFFRTRTGKAWTPNWWNDPANWQEGTLTLSDAGANLQIVATGNSTTIRTSICNGTDNSLSKYVVLRYPDTLGGYNWVYISPKGTGACATGDDDTVLLLDANWPPTTTASGNADRNDLQGSLPVSNLVWFLVDQIGGTVPEWQNWGTTGGAPSTANFYDNVFAYFSYCKATGLTAYCDHAQTLAYAWVTSPFGGGNGLAYRIRQPRDHGATGIALTYYYDTAAYPNFQTYLRRVWTASDNFSAGYTGVGEREHFYVQWALSDCALVDPTHCNYTSKVKAELDRAYLPWQCTGAIGQRNCRHNYRQWATNTYSCIVYGGGCSWQFPYDATRVNVTNGSNIVTLTGGTWPSNFFDYSATNRRALWVLDPATNGTPIATEDYAHVVMNNQVSDTTGRITWVDSTHAQLPYVWPGPTLTGAHWQYGSYPTAFLTMPYQQGIAGMAMARHYEASIANSATYATAKNLVLDMARYIRDYGWDDTSGQKGLYYVSESLVCDSATNGGFALVDSDDNHCVTGRSTARYTAPEVTRTFAYAAFLTDDPEEAAEFKQYADMSVAVAFGDPSCHPNCGVETDQYGADDIKYPVGGLAGGTYTSARAKDFGLTFGVGGSQMWAGLRGETAWPRSPTQVNVTINIKIDDITNATVVRIHLQDGNGVAVGSPTDCTESPCSITLPDDKADGYMVKFEYRTASASLVSSAWEPLRR
jgi:hypothetical protein